MNSDYFIIEEDVIQQSRDICKFIENGESRALAVANTISAISIQNFFENYNVDIKTSLFNINSIIRDFDIYDIYINDACFCVVTYFDDTHIELPKFYTEKNILPDAFIFIKMEKDISCCSIKGFLTPEAIENRTSVTEEDLLSFFDIEHVLSNFKDVESFSDIDAQIYNYIDNKIDDEKAFFEGLFNSKNARIDFIKVAKAQSIFNFIAKTDEYKNKTNLTEQDDLILTENNEEIVYTLQRNDEITEESEPLGLQEGDGVLEEAEPITLQVDEGVLEEAEPIDLQVDDGVLEEAEPIDLQADEGVLEEAEPITLQADEGVLEEAEPITLQADEGVLEEAEPITLQADEGVLEEAEPITLQADDIIEEPETAITQDNINSLDIIEFSEDTQDDFQDTEENTISDTYDLLQKDLPENETIVSDEVTQDLSNSTEDENTDFNNFKTNTTTNLHTIEQTMTPQEFETDNNTDIVSDEETSIENNEEISETAVDDINLHENEATNEALPDNTTNNDNIDTLFNNSIPTIEHRQDTVKPKGRKSNVLAILSLLIVSSALGYFGYTKYFNKNTEDINTANTQNINNSEIAEPMPDESVSNDDVTIQDKNNIIEETDIQTLEKNIDSSILVSNLSVNWEVPQGYTQNTTAKRYFTKIGKIIQLNLKTELLLLSKPPITNKVTLELTYDKSSNHFKIEKIIESSGESEVDKVIKYTVEKVLNMNLNSNMSIFSNIQGNPVLIINI